MILVTYYISIVEVSSYAYSHFQVWNDAKKVTKLE